MHQPKEVPAPVTSFLDLIPDSSLNDIHVKVGIVRFGTVSVMRWGLCNVLHLDLASMSAISGTVPWFLLAVCSTNHIQCAYVFSYVFIRLDGRAVLAFFVQGACFWPGACCGIACFAQDLGQCFADV